MRAGALKGPCGGRRLLVFSCFLEQEALPEADIQRNRPRALLPGFVASSDTDYSSEVLVIRKGTGFILKFVLQLRSHWRLVTARAQTG